MVVLSKPTNFSFKIWNLFTVLMWVHIKGNFSKDVITALKSLLCLNNWSGLWKNLSSWRWYYHKKLKWCAGHCWLWYCWDQCLWLDRPWAGSALEDRGRRLASWLLSSASGGSMEIRLLIHPFINLVIFQAPYTEICTTENAIPVYHWHQNSI